MKTKRIITLAICLLTLIGIFHSAPALAAGSTVTIESQTNSAFDYLEYYSSGSWHDLNTPRHWIEQTGEVVYCVEHSAGNPHGQTYTETSPSSVFSGSTLAGINSILMYGYPNNKPSGFTDDEARQATANALRFWLSEQGEGYSYDFTNRRSNPNAIRAKSGYEHVLEYADELLAKARARQDLPHGVDFSPSTVQLTASENGYIGQTSVLLTNINSGYTLDTSRLPSGSRVSGYTGNRSETLTITLPASAAGQSFSISAEGMDTRSIDNITAYVPANGSLQKVFLCATTAQVVATAQLSVGAPEAPKYGKMQLVKTGKDNMPLAGVVFGIYSDADCKNKLAELTTDSNGTAISGDLPVGTVYIKELSTIKPYILSAEIKSLEITDGVTAEVSFSNSEAIGKIRIEKTGDVLTAGEAVETEYGNVSMPIYKNKGLAGVVYEVKDSAGNIVATITTDKNGIAETEALPLGSYTAQEKSAPDGYVIDDTVHETTLTFKDQNTAIVMSAIKAENKLRTGGVKLLKYTEKFNADKISFEKVLCSGYVFGLYTAEDAGDIPADVLLEVLTTDEQGIAQSTVKLPYGKYYLKELATPDSDIKMLTDKLPLIIDSELNTQYVSEPILNEMFKGKIGVYKLDAEDNERGLAGAVFEVREASGKLVDTITTDTKGYAETNDLPTGEYKIKELTPPPGFILSDEIKTVTITSEDKETAVFELTNKPNEVTLTKTDLTTEKPVPGAAVEVYGKDGKLFYKGVTDKDGKITIRELPAGTYTFKETISPDGYALNANTFSFEIDAYGKVTGTTAFTDEPIVLTIKKVDAYTGKPMAGISFTLKDSEGNIVKTKLTDKGYRIAAEDGEETFSVDNNGCAEFRYLKAGKYSLMESVPAGYIAEDSISFELSSAHSMSKPLNPTINNCPTGIKLIKLDVDTNKPLTGAGFSIKVKDGLGFSTLTFTKQADGKYIFDKDGKDTVLMVDNNGEVVILGMPLGAVWIEESVVPAGYFPITARKAEVTKDTSALKPLEIKIPNSKSVKLGLDNDWWEIPAMVAGAAAVLGGAVYLYIRNKRRK